MQKEDADADASQAILLKMKMKMKTPEMPVLPYAVELTPC